MKCCSYSKSPIEFKLIAELYKSAFNNRDLDEDYWSWRFLKNPESSKQYINYIIEDGKLVAYYAVSPCEIIIDGGKHRIALSNMTMTHPNYTRRGYFKLLANKLYEELKTDGFIGVFGFANQSSHYGFKKNLGWKDLNSLNIFSLTKDDFNITKTNNNYSFKSNEISKEDILDIKKNYFSQKSIFLNRSSDWLDWRLIENPCNQYFSLKIYNESNLIETIIYKQYLSSIDIMEVFYSGEHNRFDALSSGINHLLNNESDLINYWSNLHSEEYGTLEKMRFKEGNFITYFGIIPFLENEKLLDIRNWHFRFIDSDVF